MGFNGELNDENFRSGSINWQGYERAANAAANRNARATASAVGRDAEARAGVQANAEASGAAAEIRSLVEQQKLFNRGQHDVEEAVQDRSGKGRGRKGKAERTLDLFAAAALPKAATQIAGNWTVQKQVDRVRSGFDRITNAEQAAHVFAGLRKADRELFHALVLDRADRPERGKSRVGGRGSSTIPPGAIAFNWRGAANRLE
jgi:large exoprotein involved in heme utilization and adhesion